MSIITGHGRDGTLPIDTDLECNAASLLIQDPTLVEGLVRDDFHDLRLRPIFDAVTAGVSGLDKIAEWLDERMRLDDAGGVEFLSEVAVRMPFSLAAQFTVREVHRLGERRRMIAALRDSLAAATNPATDLDDLRTDFAALATRLVADGLERRHAARTICLADVEAREVSWLWRHRIPLGRLTLLVGQPGVGKSFQTADMAARVSTGSPWPDGSPCPDGSVVLLSAEDDPADTIRPRLDAHLADVHRVHLLTAVGGKNGERCVTLGDVGAIEDCLRSIGDVRLVVVDPIGSYLGSGTDAHRDNEVRGVLGPIAALAAKYDVAVLIVAHRRKSSAGNADDMALGSKAFVGLCRATWHLTRDTADPSRRLLLPGKNNLGPEGGGLAWTIIPSPARIAWEADAVRMTADDALRQEQAAHRPGPAPEARTSAEQWLRDALADGPRPAADIKEDWRDGEGGSVRTLERAKSTIGVEAYRPANPGPWYWRLEHTAKHTAT